MAASTQSFIDIAALDAVRRHFAAADGVVILTTDLSQIIWANGPGAALLGFPGIEAAIGADSGLSRSAKRQIEATPDYPEIGSDRPITVRLAAGLISQVTNFRATRLTLPGDERAIMLVVPFVRGASRTEQEIAERAISGFDDPGNYLALLDAGGRPLAATPGFDRLGMAPADLSQLVDDISGEDDRLLKRIVRVAGYAMPIGLARLADDPALHLLITVDERQLPVETVEAPASVVDDSQSAVTAAVDLPAEPFAATLEEAPSALPSLDHVAAQQSPEVPSGEPDAGDLHDDAAEVPAAGAEVEDVASVRAAGDEGRDLTETSEAPDEFRPGDTAAVGRHAPAESQTDSQAGQHDAWYFSVPSDGEAAQAAIHEAAPVEPARAPTPEIDRAAAPVRFVWRTDAQGRFTSVSPEFVSAVGEAAADIVGASFDEAAQRLALDPDREIATLLERRDTWSGRSVLWPMAGTEFAVPVDLAALPAYDRERRFEGFRGFGVVRLADAVVDPRKTGLFLGNAPEGGRAGEDRPAPQAADEAPDPFQGEVPALEVASRPRERRHSDKVIRLAEHRAPANDKGLSPLERSAFREIGEHLKRTSTDVTDAAEQAETGRGGLDEPAVRTADLAGSKAEAASPEVSVDMPAEPNIEPTDKDAEPATVETASLEAPERTDLAERSAETEDSDAPSDGDAAIPTDEAASDNAAEFRAKDVAATNQPIAEPAEPAERASEPDAPDAAVADHVGTALQDAGSVDSAADPAMEVSARSDTETPGAETREVQETKPADRSAGAGPAAYASRSLFDFVDRGTRIDEGEPQTTGEAAGLPVTAPPPLRQTGFLPSAFAERRADTSILAQLPIPVLVHSGDALHYANDAFLDLTGYAGLEDLAAHGGLDALLSGPAADRPEGDNRVMMRTRQGDEFPVGAFLQSVPWLGGKALLLTLTRQPAAASDTMRQEELEARVSELRTILDTATDGVVLIDNDGMVRSISRPAEALFGYEGEQIVGKPFTALFAVESQRSAQDYLSGLSGNGVASVLNDGREVIGREAQGRFIPLFMTVGRLPGDSGYCAVLRDITHWKRAEEDLTQARAQAERTSSQKSDFLARVSHEIRTPLNAIIGFSELMIDEKFGPIANDRYRDYLRDINRSGNHVLDLVNDLLDISKIEAGQQEMDYEAISLNDALTETVAMMQPQANRERVIIRSSFASKLPEVVADLRSVRQIALNILSNAIRYTQAGGQVIVSTAHEPNGEVVMRVRDTGIGMTQSEIEQALKPFKQVNALKRARGDGTGLGLPLTKAMVEANRARFAIYSTPGEGTLVEVTFPSTRVLAG